MYRKLGIAVLVALAIIAWAVLPAASQKLPNELAVYDLTGGDSKDVGKKAFGLAGGQESVEGSDADARDVIKAGDKKLDVHKKSKAIHFSAKAMRDPLSTEAKEDAKNLPDKTKAISAADKILRDLGPASGGVLSLQPAEVSGSGAAIFDVAKGTTETIPLDVLSTSPLTLTDQGLTTPVLGASYKVTLGANAEVIGYSGPQPGLKATKGKTSKAITKEAAEAKFKGENKDATNVNSRFAYYLSPDENILLPVWAISSSINLNGIQVPSRTTLVSAIEGREVFPGKKEKVVVVKRSNKEALPKETPTADDKGADNKLTTLTGIPGEAGTEYIGVSGGLPQSRANALGFTSALRSAGWKINFEWGDADAWETDWIANDDSWVDTADIVFYSGHANSNGWAVSPPNDNFVANSEVGARCATPDIWGVNDLEWITIAACGPLQDSHIPGASGDAFARWGGAFDGLHTLMGYAQVTYDQPYEGVWFANNMKAGMPIIDAWFRAARDAQPDGRGIYAAALYGVKGTANPRNDHLWGYGSVCADPYPCPDYLVLTWSPC